MPTRVDRDEVVALLREEFSALLELGEGLSDEQWATPTCLPGWTVQDSLSHLAGTEAMLLGDPTPTVDISHLPHVSNDIARANEVWVESRRAQSGADVLGWFSDVTDRRLAALDAMDQAAFDEPSWTPAGPDETYGRFMRIRHYDCYLHEHDMRAAAGVADRDDPRHVTSAMTEPVIALGYIVGRRAKLPAGTTVRLSVTGPVEATWLVEVAERANVVDQIDGDPSVGVRMPVMTFLRLTGGRAVPGAVDGDLPPGVEVTGDQGLGRQLASNLAFTI